MTTADVRRALLTMRGVTFWEAEIRRQQNHEGDFLVARRGRHVEGFAGSTIETDGRWELVWLFVTPEAVGHGIGHELHEAIVAGALHARPRERFLWAVPGNRRAERFYTDRGWQTTTETKDVTTPAGTFPLRKWILPV